MLVHVDRTTDGEVAATYKVPYIYIFFSIGNFFLIPTSSLPSVITLSGGKGITLKVVSGEIDPSKKTPVEKRPYKEIWNWKAGCPDCGKTPKSYEAFRKHRSDKERCKPKT